MGSGLERFAVVVELSMEVLFKTPGREDKQAMDPRSEAEKHSGMHVLHPPQEEDFWTHA